MEKPKPKKFLYAFANRIFSLTDRRVRDYVAIVVGFLTAITVGQSSWDGTFDESFVFGLALGVFLNVFLVYVVAAGIDLARRGRR